MTKVEHSIAISKFDETRLRRRLLENGERMPLVAVTRVRSWVWDAVCEVARRDGMSVRGVLARAVRLYVTGEGFTEPTDEERGADAQKPPSRPGLATRIAEIFRR